MKDFVPKCIKNTSTSQLNYTDVLLVVQCLSKKLKCFALKEKFSEKPNLHFRARQNISSVNIASLV